MTYPCAHLAAVTEIAEPGSSVCDTCVEMGDTWVHLRACLQCGNVGCCDDSKNQHARHHWQDHGHGLIQSIEPGETWRWCFEDKVGVR